MSAKPKNVAEVEGDRCPFCGAEFDHEGVFWRFYKCATVLPIDLISTAYGAFEQSSNCKDRQLAAQAALLVECLEMVIKEKP